MLDRSLPPQTYPLEQLQLPEVQEIRLDNGIPVYIINQGTQEVLKLEVVFEAGRPYEHGPLIARSTMSILKEGSDQFTSEQVGEILDFYGSSLSTPFNMDTSSLILYSLNKHFEKVIKVYADLLLHPTFASTEIYNFAQRQINRLQVDLSKTDVVAYRMITEQLFGPTHPYGYNSQESDYRSLNRQDLIRHFEKFYQADACKIFISGKVGAREVDLLNTYLGKMPAKGKVTPNPFPVLMESRGHLHLTQPGAMQSAIRMGARLFERSHPRYQELYVLNTILGGYFGSRLMTNIREDKGYTYNIYSMLDCMRFDGCWIIGSEVGNDFAQQTLQEIYLELDQLREYPVEEEELSMVRSYLLGNLLSLLDGPFNVSELIKTMITEGVALSSFAGAVNTVQQITSETLLDLANTFLRKEYFQEVIVGPER